MIILYVVLIVLVLIVLWAVGAYNHFIRMVQRAKEAWADIDVQLKRRYDLIPNLVETVKGYATHERGVFENVTAARSAAMGASGTAAKGQAENMLSGALKSLFAATEVLKNGHSLHIFPEGTRSATGELLPFKRGAFRVAREGGAPVLPVTIIGSHLITPKKSLIINKGKIKVIIGKPIQPSSFGTVEELMNACSEAVTANFKRYSNS